MKVDSHHSLMWEFQKIRLWTWLTVLVFHVRNDVFHVTRLMLAVNIAESDLADEIEIGRKLVTSRKKNIIICMSNKHSPPSPSSIFDRTNEDFHVSSEANQHRLDPIVDVTSSFQRSAEKSQPFLDDHTFRVAFCEPFKQLKFQVKVNSHQLTSRKWFLARANASQRWYAPSLSDAPSWSS